MKVWFIAVLLAVAVTSLTAAAAKSKTEVEVAVTDVPEAADDEVKVETVGEDEEESETEGKEEEGSNESSSEENEEENEEEEESSTKAAEEVTATTVKVTPVVYSTTEAYRTIKPAYVIRPTAATYSPSKVNYIQVPGPVYKPVVVTTTEAPYKPLTVVSEVKPSVPTVKPKPTEPSKYVKPASIITAALETTTKYAPIVFEKPSSAPVVTVRKSGWVRAPGYNLGYARSESSGPAVVETPKTSAVSSGSQPATKKVVTRQSQWFFKPKSAAISISN